jgi:hypothetical protein
MLHTVLATSFGNTNATSSGRGDIISGGYESGSTRYMLNIRPNVILTGTPRLETQPARPISNRSDNRVASMGNIVEEIEALRAELATIRQTEFGRQLPIGTIVMWTPTSTGGSLNVPPCWEEVPELRGRFPIGVGTAADGHGRVYQARSVQDNVSQQGQAFVTLQMEQMPRHNHGDGYFSSHGSGSSRGGGSGHGNIDSFHAGGRADGSTAPHENRPPFYGVYFIRKTSNTCQ